MFTKVVLLLLAAVGTYGLQYNVLVGAGGLLTYEPEYVKASVGDTVVFTFDSKNHSVTQSSFDHPCMSLEGGIDSNFVFVPPDTPSHSKPSWSIDVHNADTPMWFYCMQGNHCSQGMVFAINPPDNSSERSFAAFKNLAKGQAIPSTTSTTPAATTTDTWSTPPPQPWEIATATISWNASIYTTTYTSYQGASVPSPAVTPVHHTITVGADNQLVYSPANITAAVGDEVTFVFQTKNHTVTQSSFSNPCQAVEGGFKSGFRNVAVGQTDLPTFHFTINDTAPIWGYCEQGTHCSSGMVFSINAVESGPNNYAAFLEIARRSGSNTTTSPGSTSTASGAPASTTTTNAAAAVTMGQRSVNVYGAMIGLFVVFGTMLL